MGHKEDKVKNVLKMADKPMGPTEIARWINEPWCKCGNYYYSSVIVPMLRRIGAIRHDGGKYSFKED